ncbi:hypothetical protein BO71DRAFT_400668 [Aspergillus ellipticus CBS 707.79]|uniref:Zn(2)-C6 fungal-type domain-containing protein n=1 Tax=Aspergillus ellipticus CBS 707.79 TaxID=1448320 RepID=A0A319EMT7_9EURO|nr:hypothetical protein BO71DRAFT_400668 [Aspergillus ellipticus CBS 707.79]
MSSVRLRHVKCGEEKPGCSQCARSGRKCDGYTDASQNQLHHALVKAAPRQGWSPRPDRNIVLVPGTREERHYVQFFCTQTAHALSGFFPSDFWNQFLPQLSHRNPAVRHAVAAVGALHQCQLQGRLISPSTPRSTENHEFILQQYNKAIRQFLQQMGNPADMKIDMMLIQCVLFICLEMLNGNTKQAMDHVQGGLQILSRQLQDQQIAAQRSFDRDLFQFFYRQNIQLSYFGRRLMPFMDTASKDFPVLPPNENVFFDNIDQARDCLTSLTTRGLSFIRAVQERTWRVPRGQVSEQQLDQQSALLAELKAWFSAFEAMQKKSARTIGILDPRAPLSLLCQYYAAVTWLRSCTFLDERNFDRFYPNFEKIVSAGERVVQASAQDEPNLSTEHFFLDADVLPVLYWAIMHCRHPILRRRALTALENYPAREGLWERRTHVAVARRYIELEETAVAHLPVEQRLVAERNLIYDAAILPEMEAPLNPCPVLFRLKPDGPDAPWDERWENLSW